MERSEAFCNSWMLVLENIIDLDLFLPSSLLLSMSFAVIVCGSRRHVFYKKEFKSDGIPVRDQTFE